VAARVLKIRLLKGAERNRKFAPVATMDKETLWWDRNRDGERTEIIELLHVRLLVVVPLS